MKLAVFASLLVVLTAQAVSASCAGTTVEVFVANGQDLTGDGLVEFPDPYVVVSIGGKTYRTSTINNDSNPVWSERVTFKSTSSSLLQIDVWEEDEGLRGGDDHLGTCMENLSQTYGDNYRTIECVVAHGGRVKVFYKCFCFC